MQVRSWLPHQAIVSLNAMQALLPMDIIIEAGQVPEKSVDQLKHLLIGHIAEVDELEIVAWARTML